MTVVEVFQIWIFRFFFNCLGVQLYQHLVYLPMNCVLCVLSDLFKYKIEIKIFRQELEGWHSQSVPCCSTMRTWVWIPSTPKMGVVYIWGTLVLGKKKDRRIPGAQWSASPAKSMTPVSVRDSGEGAGKRAQSIKWQLQRDLSLGPRNRSKSWVWWCNL